MVRKFQMEYGAGLTFDGNLGSGARGIGRPIRSWLDSPLLVRRRPRVVDFVGRLAADGHVWSEFIVPFQKPDELTAKVLSALGNQNAPSALIFKHADESFNHSDAAMSADGAEAWLDAAESAPMIGYRAVKLNFFVRDQVLGF